MGGGGAVGCHAPLAGDNGQGLEGWQLELHPHELPTAASNHPSVMSTPLCQSHRKGDLMHHCGHVCGQPQSCLTRFTCILRDTLCVVGCVVLMRQ